MGNHQIALHFVESILHLINCYYQLYYCFRRPDLVLDQWFSYVSGTYANVGSGYPGAFGFLTPDFNNVYFNLNMKPDFTLIQWQGKTPTEAVQIWEEEFNALSFHASTPIIHWLWHDYGATKFEPGYTWEMYDNTLAMAFGANTEFTTLANACDRINAFTAADLTVTENGAITAQVAGTGMGQFALSVDSDDVIQSVTDWYAYSDRTVFVPRNGGTFTMQLGPTQDERTRIVSLPMRADLISVTGDGEALDFAFEGEGEEVVRLNIPDGEKPQIDGPDSHVLNGTILEMQFAASGVHGASISLVPITYELTMEVVPAGGGTTDPVVGSHTKGWEEEVAITATAKPGYAFSHWTGDVADGGAQTTTVTMSGNKTVTAHFSPITYELTMAVDPAEGGTTGPEVGTHTKGWEEEVAITATANEGHKFDHWIGDVADPDAESTTVMMDGDRTVTAHFSPDIGSAAKSMAAIYLLLLDDASGSDSISHR